jgi:hypothetical protein
VKKEIADLWVNALKYGAYYQGKHYLRSEMQYCCLGVLCNLKDPNAWANKPGAPGYVYDGMVAALPKSVMEWAGVRSDIGRFDKKAPPLSELNDMAGASFDEIADIIEKNWEAL